MCGIAGYVGRRRIDDATLGSCLALMRHRGPDALGSRRFETHDGRHGVLLHTRLAIIDLDRRADQPFTAGRTVMAFNGELYNYLEVRRKLEREGAVLTTESDTEVLAQVIDRHGIDGLADCEGMWAIASCDTADATLTLVRDRFGEKPLYVFEDDGEVYFGSEPKFVFALLGRRLPPNKRQIQRFLVNGYKALYKHGATFFEGLSEVPAGGAVIVGEDGRTRRCAYWTPPPIEPSGMSYEAAVAGTRDRLTRSVELRLRADVPLAFCLSGGIDSNGLVSIAKRELGYDVHGYTIVNDDARYEEQELVEESVRKLGLKHTAIPVDTAGFLPKLRTLVAIHDAPVYTITYYAHWLLQEAIAADGYKISVSGTGADELFSGYYDHHLAYLREVRGDAALHARSKQAWLDHVRPIVRNPFLQDPDRLVRDPQFRDHIYLGADEFAAHLREPFAEAFTEHAYTGDVLRNRMLNELFAEAVPVILHEDDLNAMAFSVENRSPYLDRELFEFSLTIPTRHLVREGRAKAPLRDAIRGLAPDRIVDSHRKVGFNAPIRSYLDTSDAAVRAELLADSPIFDIVRRDRIEEVLDRPELPNSQSKFLFSFVSTKLFLEEAGR